MGASPSWEPAYGGQARTWAASRVRGPKEDKSPMVCVPNGSIGPGRAVRAATKLELPKLRGGLPKLGTGIRSAGTYLTLQQRFSPEWTVSARGLRGKHIGPGRDVRVGPKFELPKLQGGLTVLRTGIRSAGTYLGCQQGPRPERR